VRNSTVTQTYLTSDNSPLSEPINTTSNEGKLDRTPTVDDYVRASINPNTRKAYQSDLEHFANGCYAQIVKFGSQTALS